MISGKLEVVVRALISTFIIVMIINLVGLEEIQQSITKIKIEYFIITLLVLMVSTLITTVAVLPLIKTKAKLKVLKFKAISWSIGMLLPSKIGEISFALLLRKINVPPKKAVAIFFVDRFVSFSIIAVFALLSAIKYLKIWADSSYISVMVIIAMPFLVLFLFQNRIKEIKLVKKKLAFWRKTKKYLKTEKNAIIANYFFSLVNFLLIFWVTQIIFLLIGQKVSLIDITLISSLALFISLIPVTISGVGLREGILIYLYSLIGIEPVYSVSIAFLFLVSSYFLAGTFLIAFLDEFSFVWKKTKDEFS
jgi:hypothetical protein